MYDTENKAAISMKRLDVGVHNFDKIVKRSPERSIYYINKYTDSID